MTNVITGEQASPAPPPRPRAGPGLSVRHTLLAYALFVMLGALFAGLGAALPQLRVIYQLGPTSGSELISVFNAGSLLSTLTFGIGARRLPPRRSISVLVSIIGCAAVLMGFAASWPMLLITALVAGTGFGGLVVLLNTAFAKGFGERSAIKLSILNAVFGLGAIGGPLLIGTVGLANLPFVFTAIGVLILLCWQVRDCASLLTGSEQGEDSGVPAGRLRRGLPILLAFAAIGLVYASTETGVSAWQSTYLVGVGYSVSAAAQLDAGFWAGSTLGRLVIPALTVRMAPQRVVLICTAFAVVALFTATSPALAPISYSLAGFALGPVLPTVLAWMAKVAPSSAQSTTAAILGCGMLGSVLSPIVIGGITGSTPGPLIPITIGVFATLTLLALFNAARVARRAKSSEAESIGT
ncbi:MFS transporter [Amycolatopsis roodepoortensis]|uniref:MFS transporter n=1 Tax=Amycolatopsis roodepoortensis TaxID=700274 RepID=UPI00214CE45F|nr:MFS transporter [Amycolatopsis roodepoortensis]UUV29052.1 MFS transporter [Amycolatopsis roodepoortensis]